MLMTAGCPWLWKMSQAVFPLGQGGADADLDEESVGEALPPSLPRYSVTQGA